MPFSESTSRHRCTPLNVADWDVISFALTNDLKPD